MKKFFIVLLAAAIGGLCGCARHYDKVVFLSKPPVAHLDSEVAPAKPVLSAEEIRQIEQQAFERLLNGHFGDDGDYSAIFLQGDEAQTTALMKKFPQHHPPVKQLWHANIRPGFTPMDKDTGRPAMIFSLEIGEPENDTATVIARWYAGEAVKGFYFLTFHLKPEGCVLSAE